MAKLNSIYRSHTCGELRADQVGKEVTLSGWIHRKRDHGGVVFVDLRDNYGVTQVVFSENLGPEIQKLRIESVIQVKGVVVQRTPEMVNPKIGTGQVEVHAAQLELHSPSEVLPFQIAEDDKAPETTRLKYRFLELRREKLHHNIILRSQVIKAIRDVMYDLGFNEFQTPILTSSSPEGARDFIVPSRLHPGKFFALPQAPQMFKQLLMVAGFDRYFQIAPCFRDEDARADRSPGEFYQVDMEMSFVTQEEVFEIGEKLFTDIFTRFSKDKMTAVPFPRLRYDDSLAWYGSDKPDLRIPIKIEDVSEVFSSTEFKVFKSNLESGHKIRAIKLALPQIPSRKYFDDTVEGFSKATGLGLAYLNFDGADVKGTVAKFFQPAEIEKLKSRLEISQTTVVFFATGADKQILPQLGKLRVKLGQDFNLIQKGEWKFVWITDYPMYEVNPETNQIEFSHNPFSMPQGGMDALLNKDPLEIYAYQYDLVCNGYEMLSGAIRNHKPEIMYKAFEIAGHGPDVVDSKFGGMISAFKFGAPPHGGFAPGVDRIVMLLAGEEAIRDVIGFPLTQAGEDLLMGAPSEVFPKQLKEAHIEVRLPEGFERKQNIG